MLLAKVLAKDSPTAPAQPLANVHHWEYSDNKTHPTEKAVSILKPLIQTFSRTRQQTDIAEQLALDDSTLVGRLHVRVADAE